MHDGRVIEQVALHQLDAIADVLEPLEILGARTAHHAVDAVALGQQQVRQMGAVLSRDAGDKCFFHRGPSLANLLRMIALKWIYQRIRSPVKGIR